MTRPVVVPGVEPEPKISTQHQALNQRAPAGLAASLRNRTAALHSRAERSGIIPDILQGRVTRHAYALYLRNLLPAYEEMERGLDRHRHRPALRLVAEPGLFRSTAIAGDLAALWCPDWTNGLALLPAGRRYAARVAAAARGNGTALIGHAYTRYFADLSGAQLMKRSLVRSLGLGPDRLAFYEFPAIPDLPAFKLKFRAALDSAAGEIPDTEIVLAEAALAFEHNINVAEAVQAALKP
jgi:heme oxygenase (biliverdin-producing, ferredoxin)